MKLEIRKTFRASQFTIGAMFLMVACAAAIAIDGSTMRDLPASRPMKSASQGCVECYVPPPALDARYPSDSPTFHGEYPLSDKAVVAEPIATF